MKNCFNKIVRRIFKQNNNENDPDVSKVKSHSSHSSLSLSKALRILTFINNLAQTTGTNLASTVTSIQSALQKISCSLSNIGTTTTCGLSVCQTNTLFMASL